MASQVVSLAKQAQIWSELWQAWDDVVSAISKPSKCNGSIQATLISNLASQGINKLVADKSLAQVT